MLMTVNSRFRKIVPALLASFAIASAGGSAARDLRSLVGESDAVVVGRVVDGSTTPPAARLTIEVERALKGDVAQRAVLTATWVAPAGQQVFGGRVVLERGLFFLHRDGATWRIIPTASGSVSHVSSTYVPLPADRTTVIEPSADPLEAVFLELAASIENGGARPGGGMVFDLAAQYRSAPTPTLKTVFQRFATSPTPRLRSLGQRALLGTGDLGTLAAVEQQQASLTPAELGQLARVITSDFRSSDPQAVAVLSRIATSEAARLELRIAAAAALAGVHTRETLPALAQLLESPNLTLRTAAVGGLAMFANNVPAGSHTPAAGAWRYRTDETIAHSIMDEGVVGRDPKYVDFWRTWWSRYRSELVQ